MEKVNKKNLSKLKLKIGLKDDLIKKDQLIKTFKNKHFSLSMELKEAQTKQIK